MSPPTSELQRPRTSLAQLVSGSVLADRNTVAAAEIRGVQTSHVSDTAAVDSKRGMVDVLERVSAVVVVGVERLASGSAPKLYLLVRLFGLGAGIHSARRDTRRA